MKNVSLLIFAAACSLLANAQQATPAEQRIAAARQQITAHPRQAEPYNNLGNLLSADKNFDEALKNILLEFEGITSKAAR